MHYYQFHIGDYISHTIHLSLEEDLAYRRLLDMYYDSESPIPNNIPLVSRKLRMSADVVKTVLDEFFELSDEGYKNFRADKEISDYHKFIDKQKLNGSKGGRPKKSQRKPTANPSQSQKNPNQQPLTTNQQPIVKATKGSRLSADWVLPSDWEEWAKQERPDLNLRSVGEQFRDYWSAKAGSGSTKLDWQATWRNWVRNQRQERLNPADISKVTVPSSSQRDPALQKLDEDYKTAKPNPEILRMIRDGLKGKMI